MSVEILYSNKASEPFLTVYQEDLRKLGIGLNLRLVTPETLFQLVMERKFDSGLDGVEWPVVSQSRDLLSLDAGGCRQHEQHHRREERTDRRNL